MCSLLASIVYTDKNGQTVANTPEHKVFFGYKRDATLDALVFIVSYSIHKVLDMSQHKIKNSKHS